MVSSTKLKSVDFYRCDPPHFLNSRCLIQCISSISAALMHVYTFLIVCDELRV